MRETSLGENFLKKSINQTRTWAARAKKGKKPRESSMSPGHWSRFFHLFSPLMTWISGRCVAAFFFSCTNSKCFSLDFFSPWSLCVRRGWLWTRSALSKVFQKLVSPRSRGDKSPWLPTSVASGLMSRICVIVTKAVNEIIFSSSLFLAATFNFLHKLMMFCDRKKLRHSVERESRELKIIMWRGCCTISPQIAWWDNRWCAFVCFQHESRWPAMFIFTTAYDWQWI